MPDEKQIHAVTYTVYNIDTNEYDWATSYVSDDIYQLISNGLAEYATVTHVVDGRAEVRVNG